MRLESNGLDLLKPPEQTLQMADRVPGRSNPAPRMRPRSAWLNLALALGGLSLTITTLAVASSLLASAGISLLYVESNGVQPSLGNPVLIDGVAVPPAVALLVVLPLAVVSVFALVRLMRGRPLWLVGALAGWLGFALAFQVATGASGDLGGASIVGLIFAAIGAAPELQDLRHS